MLSGPSHHHPLIQLLFTKGAPTQSKLVKHSKCMGSSNTVNYFWYRLSNHVFSNIFDAPSTKSNMFDDPVHLECLTKKVWLCGITVMLCIRSWPLHNKEYVSVSINICGRALAYHARGPGFNSRAGQMSPARSWLLESCGSITLG